jgi:hypothetical protein
MIAVDYIILAIIVISAVMGLVRGLLREAIAVITWFLAIVSLGFRALDREPCWAECSWVLRCASGLRRTIIFVGVLLLGGRDQRGTWTLRSRLHVGRHGQVPGASSSASSGGTRDRGCLHHRRPGDAHGRGHPAGRIAPDALCQAASPMPLRGIVGEQLERLDKPKNLCLYLQD